MNADAVSVGIVGAGSVAFGTAALLCQNGHNPMIWSPSGARTAQLSAGSALYASNAVEGKFHPRVAKNVRDLAHENTVIVLALPANGHKTVMDALAPHLSVEQTVIVSSHASLGALYLAQLLRQRGISIPIIAWGTTITTGRQQDLCTVKVNTVRAQVDICSIPADSSAAGLKLCKRLFGDRFVQRDGLLAISLSNLNPQNHMGIALGNMSRMEHGESWSQGKNVTPKIGALLEALDRERLVIADALGLSVRTIFEHFNLSFHVPISSVSQMNQLMHDKGTGGTGPASADSRYITEDVPYGLVFTTVLGDLCGHPAKLHKAGVAVFSAMYDRDFTAENDLLTALNLQQIDLDELQEAAISGTLRQV